MDEFGLTAEGVFHQDASTVFARICDVEQFSVLCSEIVETRILNASGSNRRCSWEVLLRGARLRWIDEAKIDEGCRVMTFAQESGDLSCFDGRWEVSDIPKGSRAFVEMRASIGIPMLATMLNPVAAESLGTIVEALLTALGAVTTSSTRVNLLDD